MTRIRLRVFFERMVAPVAGNFKANMHCRYAADKEESREIAEEIYPLWFVFFFFFIR